MARRRLAHPAAAATAWEDVVDPKLTLDNPEIVRRHICAFLLQNYHQDRLPIIDPDIVAICFVGATDINREMVRCGWAIECKKYSDGRYAGAEAEVKAARAGLWAGTFRESAEWRKSHRAGEVDISASACQAGTREVEGI